MNSNEIKQRDKDHVLGTYARNDIVLTRGKGATAWTPEGKKMIDFSSGIGVNSLGFADDGWVEAIYHQAKKLQHTSNLFYTEPCGALAQELNQRAGTDKVFFCNSGTETTEGVIKAARKYSRMKYGEGRYEIITLKNSFHGRTMGAISATGQDQYHQHFDPFLDGFVHAEPNDFEDFKRKVSNKTCAVIIELIQGEGGVNVMDKAYVKAVSDYCKEHDILFVDDEVQTGIGRTGKLFAFEHYGIKPDMITVAKGLGGGLPIGAILFAENCSHALSAGDHGTTFGGNPVVAAGALEILARIDRHFLQQVADKGAHMRAILEQMPQVKEVTGLGLMLGVVVEGKNPKEVVKTCLENGLIVITAKDRLRLLPPLTITYEEIDTGLAILKHAIKSRTRAYLVLADGTVYQGYGFGARGKTIGEIVFTTGMTGYQEALTDPSYFGQIVTQTFPLVGNYGMNGEDSESERSWVRGYIVREWCEDPSNFRSTGTLDEYLEQQRVVGIYDIDTRALTRKIREHGVINGAIISELPEDREPLLAELKEYKIEEAVKNVSCHTASFYQGKDPKHHVVLYDFGYKRNMLNSLLARGCNVTVVPYHTTAQEVIRMKPDGIMLSNGPGNPKENVSVIENLNQLMDANIPIFGICLGHQLLALANGANSAKLKYGHRGSNQPVKDLALDRTFVTTQNHQYEVLGGSLPPEVGEVSHINGNDGSVEGIRYKRGPAFTVQFHPEACAGPQDTEYLFDQFIGMMKK